MPYRRKDYRSLLPKRIRKEDLAPRREEIAQLVVQAAFQLYAEGVITRFSEAPYKAFILVELVHGTQWRRGRFIIDNKTAREQVIATHEKMEAMYDTRVKAAELDDGIDRRMVLPKDDKRTVIDRGVNYKILGDMKDGD